MFRTLIVTMALVAPLTLTAAQDVKWVLAWHDEFTGPVNTAPDPKNWTYDQGGNGWGNHELEEYTDKRTNAFLDGHGHLAIRAIQKAAGKYTSARLKTEGRFEVKYGKIEARIKIAAGQGVWPAFWMLGNTVSSVGWPECGEIDVMENIGKEPDTVHGTVHGPGYAGGHAITRETKNRRSEHFHKRFHVYGIEWSSQQITFYLDGHSYSTVTSRQVPDGSKWVFDHPFFLLLNLAVGGDWPGNPDQSTRFPQTVMVDWVRVWKPFDANKPLSYPDQR